MTDKERLETAKQYCTDYGYVGLNILKWLIEQAEKVQELERELKECYKQNNSFSVENYEVLIPENKKLREALEFYASERNYKQSEEEYFEGYPPEIMNDTGYKARKTLEGLK